MDEEKKEERTEERKEKEPETSGAGTETGSAEGPGEGKPESREVAQPGTKEQESSYRFLKETIKAKPVDKIRLAKSLGRLAGAGAIFGLAAAAVFSLAVSGMAKRAEEKYLEDQILFSSPETEEKEGQETETGEDQEEQESEETQEQAPVIQEMTPEEYGRLYEDIFSTASEARKSLVTVIGSQNDEDWFETPYESQISGLIVAESGQDLFVLTEYRIVENVDRIQVVFCDGAMTDARFQKADSNTGLAVLKIPKSEIPETTKEAAAVAPLGETYHIKQGEPVLAIGSPMGYSDSVGYGIITSTENTVSKVDAQYSLLTTDITGSRQGSGVLLNLEGEIIGIIAQSFAREDTENLITCLPISQNKELIKLLSDNKELIYMGLTGETITSEISEKKGIPIGMFVEQVEVDSPAMQVGIQNGDVIVQIDGGKVDSVRSYQQQLKNHKSGETIEVKAMRQGTEGYVEVSFEVTLKAK